MVTMYDGSSLQVRASWVDGDLQIYGQDLGPRTPNGDEYEYWLVVPKGQLHLVASDIEADLADPTGFLRQLVAHGKRIVEQGESTWLKSLGVTAQLTTWY